MNFKQYFLIMVLYACALFSVSAKADINNDYAAKFKNVSLQSCDVVFHKLEKGCSDMVCHDFLVGAWTECWKKSMNAELNKRLLKLKKADPSEFHAEMNLQKNFNQATQNLCGKDCDQGNGMKGISYNFCRVDAYKYRTSQAIQLNKNQMTIPTVGNFLPEKVKKEKTKDTNFYQTFAEKLCAMPKAVWGASGQPADCQKKVFAELNSFEFTDDVCDLS